MATRVLTLNDPSLLVDKVFVAGQWMAAPDGATIAVIDPFDGAGRHRAKPWPRYDPSCGPSLVDSQRLKWGAEAASVEKRPLFSFPLWRFQPEDNSDGYFSV